MLESQFWELFKNEVCNERRYRFSDKTEDFLKAIKNASNAKKVTKRQGEIFFRARVYGDRSSRKINPADKKTFLPLKPFVGKEMQVPPFEKRKAGRANAKGIGVLYLASDEETAISEIRPWKGALVSTVKFELNRDFPAIDFTTFGEPLPLMMEMLFSEVTAEQKKESMWARIGREYAKPLSPDDLDVSYVATQILAEIFSNSGIGGIQYLSSMSSNGGYNLVVFNELYVNQIPESAHLVDVTGIEYKYNPYVDPVKSNIRNAIRGVNGK